MPAIKTHSQLITDITNIKSLITSDGKIDAAELQQLLTEVVRASGVSPVYTMSSNTYDCDNGDFQELALSGSGSLTVTNQVSGKVYLLRKSGAYTLTLPTGAESSGGATVPSGTYWVSFAYDGTRLSFNFSAYSTI